jgi:hypothetical protein
MKTKLFLTGLALMAVTTFMNAQTPESKTCKGQGNGKCKGAAYVDNNKNGVCDNYETRSANGNSKCNGLGKGKCSGQGKGKNFVDANKNGVCDNYEARVKK